MAGVIYGIGVGPGDPELMTLKAVRLLRTCDIVAIPARDAAVCTAFKIAVKAVPEIYNRQMEAFPIPMVHDRKRLDAAYEEGSRRIAFFLDKGKNICFLNLGDPTIYGTYMEFHRLLTQKGYQSVIINGVPSFCASAAALGMPLGYGREKIHILPGYYCADEMSRYLDGEGDTCILMKSAGKLDEVKRRLSELQKEKKAVTSAVSNASMENEIIWDNIETLDERAGYFTTILAKGRK